LWRGLPSTRWLSTTWRYSKPPDRWLRKYRPAPVCQHKNDNSANGVKHELRLPWHYSTGQFPVFPRQSAAFNPVLTCKLSKSHLGGLGGPEMCTSTCTNRWSWSPAHREV